VFPRLSEMTGAWQVRLSRLLTVFWGVVATGFALRMIGGAETVLELVNKIGSAFYGPILATFWLGMLTRRGSEVGAVCGLAAGVGLNIFLWLYCTSTISWLWWNVSGFLVSFGVGYAVSRPGATRGGHDELILSRNDVRSCLADKKYYLTLAGAFVLILAIGFLTERLFLQR